MSRIKSPTRDLRQSHWTNLKIADYQARLLKTHLFGGKTGMEAVYRVAEIDCPLNVGTEEHPLIVSDRDFWWYIMAPKDSFVWLSSAFNRERELIEIYIDITAGSDFTDPVNPCYKDMYLDVVVSPEGRVKVLDADELEEAAREGKITEEEKKAAEEHCASLTDWLNTHAEELLDFCRQRLREMAGA